MPPIKVGRLIFHKSGRVEVSVPELLKSDKGRKQIAIVKKIRKIIQRNR